MRVRTYTRTVVMYCTKLRTCVIILGHVQQQLLYVLINYNLWKEKTNFHGVTTRARTTLVTTPTPAPSP